MVRRRRHMPNFKEDKRIFRMLNAINTRLANLEKKAKEQIKQRHVSRCIERWYREDSTGKEDDEELD